MRRTLIWLLCAQFVDVLTTHVIINIIGGYEANPFMDNVINNYGILYMLLIKTVICLTIILGILIERTNRILFITLVVTTIIYWVVILRSCLLIYEEIISLRMYGH